MNFFKKKDDGIEHYRDPGTTALKVAVTGIIVIFAASFLWRCFYSVNEQYNAVVTQFGKVLKVETAGFHVKAPWQSVKKIDMTTHGTGIGYTVSNDGQNITDSENGIMITSNKKSMIADNYVIWSVVDVRKYYQTLGAVKGRAEERIEAAVYNATKNTISSMKQDEIIAARGTTLTDMITKASNSDISQYGITIELAEIKALDLPDDNKEAVYERMISERNNIAAGYTAKGNAEAQKIKNETDKQVSILTATAEKEAATVEAEGEAEYMRILSEAYNDESKADFYNFVPGLDSMEALKGEDNTIILDKDSEYARILYSGQ